VVGYASREDHTGHSQDYPLTLGLLSVEGETPTAIDTDVLRAYVAPGGDQIAYVTFDRDTRLWDGDTIRTLALEARSTQVAWFPSGDAIAVTVFPPDWSHDRLENSESPEEFLRLSNSDIVKVDLATNQVTTLVDHARADWNPVVSPDGAQMIFNSTRTSYASIYRLDFASGAVTCLHENGPNVPREEWLPVPLSDQALWLGDRLLYATSRPTSAGLAHDVWSVTTSGAQASIIGSGSQPLLISGASALAVRTDAGTLATIALEGDE
jgi:hypothetical protein